MTELFNITHDGGDFSEYDSVVTDGGDLSVAVGAAMAGSAYGMEAVIDDTVSIYGQKDFSNVSRLRARWYFDPNSIDSGIDKQVNILNAKDGAAHRIQIPCFCTNGVLWEIRADVRRDDSNYDLTAKYEITDEPHWIEIDWKASSGPGADDGFLKLWIDDDLKEELLNVDNDTHFIDLIRLGASGITSSGFTGSVYLDELKVNDDGAYIGPAALPPELQPVTLRRLVHFNYSYLLNLVWGIGTSNYTLSEATAQLCLTLLSTFPTWKDYWVGYDGFDWWDDILEDIVAQAIGELIPD